MRQEPRANVEAINPEAIAAARKALPPADQLALVVELFDALADPTRVRMLYALAAGELCVRDLALVTRVTESAVSHQLRILRDRRLVTPRREGTVIYYALSNHHLPVLFCEAEFSADHLRQSLPDHPYP